MEMTEREAQFWEAIHDEHDVQADEFLNNINLYMYKDFGAITAQEFDDRVQAQFIDNYVNPRDYKVIIILEDEDGNEAEYDIRELDLNKVYNFYEFTDRVDDKIYFAACEA